MKPRVGEVARVFYIPERRSRSSLPELPPAGGRPGFAQEGGSHHPGNRVVTAARGWETTVMQAARFAVLILAGIEVGRRDLPGVSSPCSIWLVRRSSCWILFIGLFSAFVLE